jgi:thioredoxin-dependent peroxiredoxin
MPKRETKFKDKLYPLIGPQLKAGDAAPEFECVTGLEIRYLASTPRKARLFSVVPSLDTPVCSIQTKQFDEAIGAFKDQVACFTISLDLPFAMSRFCTTEKITNMQNLSDVHDHSFSKNYGVMIEGLPFPLTSRAIFVIDKNNKITYCEYVPEVGSHPDYDAALAALKAVI